MISKIILDNFRIYKHLELDVNNKLVILSGKNACGKTSILEAIFLCSTSKSHRTNDLENLINYGNEFGKCEVLENKKNYKVVLNKKDKSFFINNQQIKKTSDFIGNLRVVLFSPFDLNLINGSKLDRRHFLDLELSLLDNKYLHSLNNYKKVLKERNEVLHLEVVNQKLLAILTEQLISFNEIIYQKRVQFLEKLNQNILAISKNMNIENIFLKYLPSYDINDVLKSFKNKEKYDLFTKTTNLGCHRDDFSIFINDNLASSYASEGQIRTICIVIKLALKQLIENTNKQSVILLLDDVFASLDAKRINSLISYVKENQQTFITTTSTLDIPDELLKDAYVLRIEKEKKE